MKQLYLLFLLSISISAYADKFVWNQKANYPSFARHRSTAISIGNKGYMGLGHINSGNISQAYSDWWEYDPATNSWTQKANYPLERFAVVGFSIGNKGYVGSGNEQNFGDRQEFFEFDPITNTWLAKADYPVPAGGNIAFAINGIGYMGFGNSSPLYSYNPTTNTWLQVTGASSIPSSEYCAAFVLNNKAYVLPSTSSTLYEYNPATNSTTTKASFIYGNRYAPTSFAVRGKGYVGFGYNWATNNVEKDFYEYDPVLNTWDTIPKSFPGVRRNYTPSFVIGDNAFLGTGSNGTNLGDVWGYEWKVAVGINEKEIENSTMSLFPNPAHNMITLSFTNDIKNTTHINITDMLGKTVLEIFKIDWQTVINIEALPRGSYFVNVINKDGTKSYKKIILN